MRATKLLFRRGNCRFISQLLQLLIAVLYHLSLIVTTTISRSAVAVQRRRPLIRRKLAHALYSINWEASDGAIAGIWVVTRFMHHGGSRVMTLTPPSEEPRAVAQPPTWEL
jgi:hypothetical protein